MKELFQKLSTLRGSLNGNRFVFQGAEAQKGPEQQVESSNEPSKDQPKTPEQAIALERTFMDKVKLKMGLTTEARLPLEKQMDGSKNQQETLNKIAINLMKEADMEGLQKDRTYVNFAKKYGVNNPLAKNAAQITFSALNEIAGDKNMAQSALDLAKEEVYKAKETEQPTKQPELVAQQAPQAPKKAPVRQSDAERLLAMTKGLDVSALAGKSDIQKAMRGANAKPIENPFDRIPEPKRQTPETTPPQTQVASRKE